MNITITTCSKIINCKDDFSLSKINAKIPIPAKKVEPTRGKTRKNRGYFIQNRFVLFNLLDKELIIIGTKKNIKNVLIKFCIIQRSPFLRNQYKFAPVENILESKYLKPEITN